MIRIVLDKADLALLVGARLCVVSALSLASWDERYHLGGNRDACVNVYTVGLVTSNNAAVRANAKLCAEHVKRDNWGCV